MRTRPRIDFNPALVRTHDECCERCNSTNLRKDVFPPYGATYNPPAAMLTKAEMQPRPRFFTCRDCLWEWFPDGESEGYYIGKAALYRNHDRGDEDRS